MMYPIRSTTQSLVYYCGTTLWYSGSVIKTQYICHTTQAVIITTYICCTSVIHSLNESIFTVKLPGRICNSMDLIRIDVISDKMAVLVWGFHHIFICSN